MNTQAQLHVRDTRAESTPRVGCRLGQASAGETPWTTLVRLAEGLPILRRRVKAGDHIFRAGARFHDLYMVHSGFVKTSYLSEDGREQVMGFHMRGDLIGLEAISNGTHGCDAVALDVGEVWEIPYEALLRASLTVPELQMELHRAMSYEIRRDREWMLTLGSLSAEERVAVFLLSLSERFAARGYSKNQISLRMTRAEIGSFLGLKLETVSRIFSRFADQGLIDVCMKDIDIKDFGGLRALIAPPEKLH